MNVKEIISVLDKMIMGLGKNVFDEGEN